jgi:hypothetical protein
MQRPRCHVKTCVRNAAVALLAIPPFSGCGRSTSSSPPRRTTAIPNDHTFHIDSGIVATELAHGGGATRLAVNRSWRGTGTLNSHFGPGWADRNVVQRSLIRLGVNARIGSSTETKRRFEIGERDRRS